MVKAGAHLSPENDTRSRRSPPLPGKGREGSIRGSRPADTGRSAPATYTRTRAPPPHVAPRWRRPAHRGPRPPRPGPAGRVRGLRGLGPRGGRGQAHVLRALRAAAPRPGVRGHRGQQRTPDPRLQGHGPGVAGVRRDHAGLPERASGDRPRAVLHHGLEQLGQRATDLPAHRRRVDRPRPQREPDQHRRAGHDGHRAPTRERRARHPRAQPGVVDQRHGSGHGPAGAPPRHLPRAARPRGASPVARRVLLRLDEREHPLRRARPAGDPTPGPGTARARLGGGQRGRRAGDHRRQPRPRGGAGRAGRDRRRRSAHPPVRRGRPEGLRVRVRLPGSPRRHDRRPQRPRGPRRDGPAAGP